MCEEILIMESNGVQTKEHGRKLCVPSSRNGVHGMNFFTKTIVPLRSTIGFVPKFKKKKFKRCRMFFQNFSINGVIAKEIHLSKVKGV